MTNPSSSSTNTMSTSSPPSDFPIVKNISQELSLKLSGTDNFLLWKTQALPVLRSQRLLGFIDGTISKPLDHAAALHWDRLDQMVLGWILISLSPAVLAQVVDKQTAREAWLTLEQVYGTSSRSRIQHLKTDLQTLQKGSKSVHEHLQAAKSLSLALASAGKGVDEEDLILYTLRGLGSDYDPIVAAINSQIVCPSFAAVSGMLLDYELRLAHSSSSPPAALVAASTHPTGQFPPTHSPAQGRGHRPTRPPSSSHGLPSRGRAPGRHGRGRGRSSSSSTSSTSSANLSNVVCYRCGHPYHKAKIVGLPTTSLNPPPRL